MSPSSCMMILCFFIAYDPSESILIFSKNSTSWGSYFYNEKEDALRIKVKPVVLDKSVEWLKYDFTNQTDNSASINLSWEKLAFSFKVEVDNIKNQIASFRNELRTERQKIIVCFIIFILTAMY